MSQIELDLQDIIDSATCAALRRRLERYDTALSEFVAYLQHLADEFDNEKICNTWNVARLRSRFDETCVRFDSVLKPLGLRVAQVGTLREQVFQLVDQLQEELHAKLPSFPNSKSPQTDQDRETMIKEAAQSLRNRVVELQNFSTEVAKVLTRKRELGRQIRHDVEYLIEKF